MSPQLSVIVPNFNDAKYLREALDAIISQTFQDFELIIIDDGSCDDSPTLIASYEQKYPQIRFLRNEFNQGIAWTLNRGVKEAKGEFFVFCSANDKILPRFFEKSLSLLNHFPEIPLSTCNFGYFSEKNPLLKQLKLLPHVTAETIFSPKETLQLFRNTTFWIPGQCVVVRRSCFNDFSFNPHLGPHMDWFIWHACALRFGVGYIPEMLTCNRVHENSYAEAMNASSKKRQEHASALFKALKLEPSLEHLFKHSTLLGPILKGLFSGLLFKPQWWNFLLPVIWKKIRRFKVYRHS